MMNLGMQQWIEIWPFFFGGIFFFTSGLLYLIEFSGNPLRGESAIVGYSLLFEAKAC